MMTNRLKNLNQRSRQTALVLNLILILAAMVGCGSSGGSDGSGGTAPAAVADPTLVNTMYGDIAGLESGDNTYQWRGIPYAKPPVGELRWKPPVAPDPWTGTLDCSVYKNQAAQHTYFANFGEGGVSEDCLYLNITAPKQGSQLPVMFWIHGGFFSILTANAANYNNAEALPTKNVIVVTVNHRLGPFGYLAHEKLREESADGLSGNYGQLDLIMALEWVQDNIEAFGGDPTNVTIFGESGGGGKVLSLITSPLAEGLFHKAIIQSGMSTATDTSIQPLPLAAAEAQGAAFAGHLGLVEPYTTADMRNIGWEDIVNTVTFKGDTATATAGLPQIIYSPTQDGYYLTDSAANIFDNGAQIDVPLMAGGTRGDGEILTGGLKELMPHIAAGFIAAGSSNPIYAYVFNHVPFGWRGMAFNNPLSPNNGRKVLAYHASELAYLFNSDNSFITHWAMGLPHLTVMTMREYNEQSPSGTYPNRDALGLSPMPTLDADDDHMVELMMTLWTNFAKTGDPSIPGTVLWAPYSSANDQYFEISTTPMMKGHLNTLAFPANPQ